MWAFPKLLIIVSIVVASCTACAGKRDSALPVSRSDPETILREANALAKRGDDALALEKYLWLADHSTEVDPAFLGVRDTILLEALGGLAVRYKPAEAAMKSRQTALENRLLTSPSSVDPMDVAFFVSLNAKLGEEIRTASVLERITKSPQNADTRRTLIRLLLNSLLDGRDREILLRNYEDVRDELLDERDTLQHQQDRLLERAYRVYGLMLADNDLDKAKSMVDVAVGVDSTSTSFRQLLNRSIGPQRDTIRQFILDKAKEHLPAAQVEQLQREDTK